MRMSGGSLAAAVNLSQPVSTSQPPRAGSVTGVEFEGGSGSRAGSSQVQVPTVQSAVVSWQALSNVNSQKALDDMYAKLQVPVCVFVYACMYAAML